MNQLLHTPGLETKADMTLLRKAIKEKWPIPQALRRKAIRLLAKNVDKALTDSSIDPIPTIRTIVEMDKVNIKHEALHTPKQHQHVHELSDAQIVERLSVLEREKNIISIQDAKEIDPEISDDPGHYLI